MRKPRITKQRKSIMLDMVGGNVLLPHMHEKVYTVEGKGKVSYAVVRRMWDIGLIKQDDAYRRGGGIGYSCYASHFTLSDMGQEIAQELQVDEAAQS